MQTLIIHYRDSGDAQKDVLYITHKDHPAYLFRPKDTEELKQTEEEKQRIEAERQQDHQESQRTVTFT